MTQDRTLAGVALILIFCAIAPLLDVASKLAAATIPVGQITTARFLLQGLIMLPVVLFMGLNWHASARVWWLITVRAVFLILSTYSFVAAIQYMPLADALAIVFVEPFILLILGSLLLGDEVGPRRIAACMVGFCGSLLVIQPSLMVFGAIALFPLGTAFFFAFYMLITRSLASSIHPVTMQLHTSIAGTLICLPLLAFFDGTGIASLDPVIPQGWAWLWLAGVGFWAAVSHMCMTYALKFAPASTLAPLHYLEIISAVGFGYLVFGDFPNALTWAGIAVIVASGMYIILRERKVARQRRAAAATAAPVH
ncbi:MAG: EamA family transporter [Cereibacter sphaeroides]|uniref:EamA family transporter n=1 Tax=Cereibacter sphaeroides TaxID=1063 RepID=A0A2W5S1H6_CERSP|nr:MAG: EamA family transporter [Cereibacter sphaeroides]